MRHLTAVLLIATTASGCTDTVLTEPEDVPPAYPPSSISISMDGSDTGGLGLTLIAPDTIRLRAVRTAGLNTDTVPVVWSSSDSTVATVSQDGVVAAWSDGSTFISAASGIGADSLPVFVEVPTADSIAIAAVADTVIIGDTITLAAVAYDSTGYPLRAITASPFDWTVRDTTVIQLADSGQAVGIAMGSTWIVATNSDWNGDVSDSVAVTVAGIDSTVVTPIWNALLNLSDAPDQSSDSTGVVKSCPKGGTATFVGNYEPTVKAVDTTFVASVDYDMTVDGCATSDFTFNEGSLSVELEITIYGFFDHVEGSGTAVGSFRTTWNDRTFTCVIDLTDTVDDKGTTRTGSVCGWPVETFIPAG